VAVVVATRQISLSAVLRRTLVRRCRSVIARALSALVITVACGILVDVATVAPASAQGFTYNPQPPRPRPPRAPNDNQMLVQATEVDYDYNNSRVSAVGNVHLCHHATSVEPDTGIDDQNTKRLHAEANHRRPDADGQIT
jgi:LPS-assembly protein